MAEGKKSFVLYCDLINTVSKLNNNKAGELFKLILQYVNDLDPKTSDILLQVAFEPVRQQLKRDLKDWEQERENRSKAGKKGMESRWGKPKKITKDNKNNRVIKPITNITDNVTVTVNDTVTVSDTVTHTQQCAREISATVLEAAERNQFLHTGECNTNFIKNQWEIFLLERANDNKMVQVQNKHRYGEYFLNWMRTKFPKPGQINGKKIDTKKLKEDIEKYGDKKISEL